MRWLARWLEERADMSLGEVVLITGALAALGGPGHEEAVMLLRRVAEPASGG